MCEQLPLHILVKSGATENAPATQSSGEDFRGLPISTPIEMRSIALHVRWVKHHSERPPAKIDEGSTLRLVLLLQLRGSGRKCNKLVF